MSEMITQRALDSRADYTVGWIAALPIERAAAIAMLDEQHKKPLDFVQPVSDKNSYTWGRIAEHNVVLASLPAGVYGTTSAATTAASMVSSFPQIRIGLMVGIGAGIPRPDQDVDIRLGDIVVSQPSGQSGGVVQYDFGKAKKEDRFERTGFLNSPPQALLNALSNLQSQHEFGSNIPQILEDMFDKHPELAKAKPGKSSYKYQGREQDRLFKSSYAHSRGRNCNYCDAEQELEREERESSEPEIHYGLIASGNTLVKDAAIRDSLIQDLGDECFCLEMEAAGLMNNFPCLVIRGICDYADSHKNDRWQRYAAATAAAYAKEFLGVIEGEDVERTQKAIDVLQDIAKNVTHIEHATHEIKAGVEHLSLDGQTQKIHSWLSPPDPSTNYNKALQQRSRGSGQWFLQSPAYPAWKTGRNSFLWLYGTPGCGKTILSSSIIEDLGKSEVCSRKLLYFYFAFSDSHKQSFEHMIRSLLTQIRHGENVQRHLDLLYASCEDGTRQPNIKALCKTFWTMVQQVGEVWIVLDALDECQTRKEYSTEGLLYWLERLRSFRHDDTLNVHLLVTSRPEPDLKLAIDRWDCNQDMISIQSGLVAEDIRAYIHMRVRRSYGLKRWQSQPKVQNEIETTLVEKANGMFRWVSCQLDALENCLDYPTLRKALESLPKTLDETYSRILDNIPPEHKHHTIRILQFLTFSERPLRINEAVDAIAVETDRKPYFEARNRITFPDEILRYCSSLVTLVKKELQLSHFSVKEYLTSTRLENSFAKDLEETAARTSLAMICLAYLLELPDNIPTSKIRQSYPLARYAARHWTSHARVSDGCREALRMLTMDFLSSKSSYEVCYKLYNPDEPQLVDAWTSSLLPSPLYYASLEGVTYIIQEMLNNGANISTIWGKYGDALQAASSRGHLQVIQTLLNHGVDINMRNGTYGNALQVASFTGQTQVVQLLLEKGANVNMKCGTYGSALQAASAFGQVQIVHLLLGKGANVNARGGNRNNALYAASEKGHADIVRMLLKRGAKVNAHGGKHGNALRAALEGGHIEVAHLLLEKGAEVNLEDRNWTNTLSNASMRGDVQAVRMLLEKGVDMNAQGSYFGNAVQAALRGGSVQIVQELLDRGADINSQDRDFDNILCAFSSKGKAEAVQTLINQGADVNAQGGYYGNALQAASAEGHVQVVQILLENGAEVNAQGGYYTYALHAASYGGHEKVIRVLVENGANISATDDEGLTPLHAAVFQHLNAAKTLYEAGADINARGEDGSSPLHTSSDYDQVETTEWLISLGADVDHADMMGRTPLHNAIYGGNDKVVELLLSRETNAHLLDGYGKSAFDWIRQSKYLSKKFDSFIKRPPTNQKHDVTDHLCHSIQKLTTRLLENDGQQIWPGYHELGHCLMYLGEQSEALTAFRQQMTVDSNGLEVTQDSICDGCEEDPTRGYRYVCKTCPDVDLCILCWNNSTSNTLPSRCSPRHDFMYVCELTGVEKSIGAINEFGETSIGWLERIRSTFGHRF